MSEQREQEIKNDIVFCFCNWVDVGDTYQMGKTAMGAGLVGRSHVPC